MEKKELLKVFKKARFRYFWTAMMYDMWFGKWLQNKWHTKGFCQYFARTLLCKTYYNRNRYDMIFDILAHYAPDKVKRDYYGRGVFVITWYTTETLGGIGARVSILDSLIEDIKKGKYDNILK